MQLSGRVLIAFCLCDEPNHLAIHVRKRCGELILRFQRVPNLLQIPHERVSLPRAHCNISAVLLEEDVASVECVAEGEVEDDVKRLQPAEPLLLGEILPCEGGELGKVGLVDVAGVAVHGLCDDGLDRVLDEIIRFVRQPRWVGELPQVRFKHGHNCLLKVASREDGVELLRNVEVVVLVAVDGERSPRVGHRVVLPMAWVVLAQHVEELDLEHHVARVVSVVPVLNIVAMRVAGVQVLARSLKKDPRDEGVHAGAGQRRGHCLDALEHDGVVVYGPVGDLDARGGQFALHHREYVLDVRRRWLAVELAAAQRVALAGDVKVALDALSEVWKVHGAAAEVLDGFAVDVEVDFVDSFVVEDLHGDSYAACRGALRFGDVGRREVFFAACGGSSWEVLLRTFGRRRLDGGEGSLGLRVLALA